MYVCIILIIIITTVKGGIWFFTFTQLTQREKSLLRVITFFLLKLNASWRAVCANKTFYFLQWGLLPL